MTGLEDLQLIVEDAFLDIITEILRLKSNKLRLMVFDRSFIDIRLSQKIKNRFDFHWERGHIDETVYRYDNFPDVNFKHLKSFPYHLHKGTEKRVVSVVFRKNLPGAFYDFMEFVRQTLKSS